MRHRRSQFAKCEQVKRPLAIVVKHPEIIALREILAHHVEVLGIPLLCQRQRDLVSKELLNPLAGELSKQGWILYRRVGAQDHQRAAAREQEEDVHASPPHDKRRWTAQT